VSTVKSSTEQHQILAILGLSTQASINTIPKNDLSLLFSSEFTVKSVQNHRRVL
jgi:hypothetical protein